MPDREPHDGPVLETRRLIIRRIRPDDAASLEALNADPRVMRYIAPPMTPDETRAWLGRTFAHDAAGRDFGWFAVQERETGALTGMAALKLLSESNHAALGALLAGAGQDELFEIGWRFHEPYWGRGYATETGRALVRRAFEHHGLPRITAVALAANLASCRAIEKCGLRPHGDYTVSGHAARFFTLTRAAWEADCETRSNGPRSGHGQANRSGPRAAS